jgi:hypothetical protein
MKLIYSMRIMVKLFTLYKKERQVKMELGESKSGRKREREKQIKSVGDRV